MANTPTPAATLSAQPAEQMESFPHHRRPAQLLLMQECARSATVHNRWKMLYEETKSWRSRGDTKPLGLTSSRPGRPTCRFDENDCLNKKPVYPGFLLPYSISNPLL
jgi:hypothetical protein